MKENKIVKSDERGQMKMEGKNFAGERIVGKYTNSKILILSGSQLLIY